MTGHQIQLFADRSGDGINWRLLAANNRETARGTRLWPDDMSCRADIARLQAVADRFTARARRAALGRWSWELSLDDVLVARSTHSFDRQIRCEQVLAVVARHFGSAGIATGLVDTAGRRRDLYRPFVRPIAPMGELV